MSAVSDDELRAEIQDRKRFYGDLPMALKALAAKEAECEALRAAFNDRVRVIELQLEDKRQLAAQIEAAEAKLEATEGLLEVANKMIANLEKHSTECREKLKRAKDFNYPMASKYGGEDW